MLFIQQKIGESMLKTKSQMIMRIAQLSEENTLLREQLYNKSETEQALQSALDDNRRLKTALEKIKTAANKFNYWQNDLTAASNVVNEIKEKLNEVM